MDKLDKSHKSDKLDKSDTLDKLDKPDKSDKLDKADKSEMVAQIAPKSNPNCSKIKPTTTPKTTPESMKTQSWAFWAAGRAQVGFMSVPLIWGTPPLRAFLAKMVTQWSHFGCKGGHKLGSKITFLSKACNSLHSKLYYGTVV